MTKSITSYLQLYDDLHSDMRLSGTVDEWIVCLGTNLQLFKTNTVVYFKYHYTFRLLTMKFQFVSHLCEHLAKFHNISFLDAATLNHFKAEEERAFKESSERKATKTKDTLEAVEPVLKHLKGNKGSEMLVTGLQQMQADSEPWMCLSQILQEMGTAQA